MHKVPSEIAIHERLFTEARTYAEKANVVDYLEDRIEFARTGEVRISRDAGPLNLRRIALAAQRISEAAREISIDISIRVPALRLVDNARDIRREIADRVAEIIQTIRNRMNFRAKERAVARDWDLGR